MKAATSFKGFILVGVIAAIGSFGVILSPQSVSAQAAGPGGGGGSPGCSTGNYATCFGAVWRYYRTSADPYFIPNIGGGSTAVRGCSATGGFFAYVLVNKTAPDNETLVRSWKIGNQNGQNNSSTFFGGILATAYTVSRATQFLPTLGPVSTVGTLLKKPSPKQKP